jgi:hypothetical protein
MMVAIGCSACATLMGPPEDTPPEAPSARLFRTLSPSLRDQMWPQLFEGRDYVDRLVCSSGEAPVWKRTEKKGLVETYELNCPGEALRTLALDVGVEAPPPPASMRQLDPKPFAKYRESLFAIERKDLDAALKALQEAEKLDPAEPIYQREQVYCLYSQGKMPDAFLRADALAQKAGSPLVYKYRALTARELGLQSEVVSSLDGIIKTSASRSAPLYAEAVCAKGMILMRTGATEAESLIAEGCSLEYKACCDIMEARHAEEEARVRAEQAEAAKKAGITIPPGIKAVEEKPTPATEKPVEPNP